MDHRDIRTLQLLEEIEKNHSPSQRQLSRKLNISLGLVNSFIKRLAQKGYFKITHIPKNRVSYILTPKGAAEKTRLTYKYLQYSYHFYKDARNKLRDLFNDFEQKDIRRIVFYGASDLAEIAYLSLQETPIQLLAVVDDFKIGKRFLRQTVIGPQMLASLDFDRILITAIESRDEVEQSIVKRGIPADKVAILS
jgi:DNA-binding MarR family transcriptional regulator